MKVVKFLKRYSLEIYTIITICFLAYAGFVDTNTIQQLVIVMTVLFLFHEWEEWHYPGGFIDLWWGNLGIKYNETIGKNSRVYTGIVLTLFTMVPFFCSDITWFILPATLLCFGEGIVHTIAGIKFGKHKPYSPGWVTAILEFIFSLFVFYYLISNNLISGMEYIYGIIIFIIGFASLYGGMIIFEGLDISPAFKKKK